MSRRRPAPGHSPALPSPPGAWGGNQARIVGAFRPLASIDLGQSRHMTGTRGLEHPPCSRPPRAPPHSSPPPCPAAPGPPTNLSQVCTTGPEGEPPPSTPLAPRHTSLRSAPPGPRVSALRISSVEMSRQGKACSGHSTTAARDQLSDLMCERSVWGGGGGAGDCAG